MKISTYLVLILVVGAIFFTFALMTSEANQNFPNANINDSDWAGKYDYASDINQTVAPLQSIFEKIEDENAGWFTRIASGILAVPLAIVQIPKVVFKSFVFGGILISGIFSTLGVPSYFLLVVLIMILLWGIFKLIEIFQRWQV